MLRRIFSSASVVAPSGAACFHISASTSSQLVQQHCFIRGASATSQYYPLHRFDLAGDTTSTADQSADQGRDLSFAEFKTMISNPGPLRVLYSEDYLDWYYRAYKEKISYDRQKKLAAAKGINNTNISSSSNNNSLQAKKPLKPAESKERQLGEKVMRDAQRNIETASIRHGLLDLYERAPQFPQVHIDRAKDEHIPMLLDEFVLRGEVNAADVWRRALIARAMLLHNRRSYPATFEYIYKVIDECVFSKPLGLGNKKNTSNSSSSSASDDDGKSSDGKKATAAAPPPPPPVEVAKELLEDSATQKYPTLALARYYEYLVKKYNIQNSAEAHILLRCHLAPDAETLLFSNPPPEEEKDPSKIGGGPDWEAALAMPLPPLDALISVGDAADSGINNNLALARVLIFAELNCNATTNNDAFAKFPKAQSLVTRPTLSESREEHERTSLENKLRHRRHHILPNLIQFTLNTIDVRARDTNRLARQSEASDMNWAANSLAAQERGTASAGEGLDGTVGGAAFNHRAIRAEVRDAANRRIIGGLKQYRYGRDVLTQRPTLLQGEEQTRFATAGAISTVGNSDDLSESCATRDTRNAYLMVSLPRFVAIVEADKHVQLILAMLSSSSSFSASNNSKSGNNSNHSNNSAKIAAAADAAGANVQRLVLEYARQLLKLGLEFHLPNNRAVQLRATRVAASLLDTAVVDALEVLKLQQRELDAEVRAAKQAHTKKSTAPTAAAADGGSAAARDGAERKEESTIAPLDQDPMMMLSSSLGGGAVGQILAERFVPFAERALDQHGFPTEAKYSDYARWMGVDA